MKRLACWLRNSLDNVFGQNARSMPGLKAGRGKRRARTRRLMLEQLEDRTLMSGNPTISWDGGAGPADLNWPNAINWTDDRLPHVNDDVGIAVPGELITVLLDTAGGPITTVNSLYSEENLEVLGGLALTAGGELAGSLSLSGGPLELPAGADLTLRGGAGLGGALHLAAGATLRLQSGDYVLGGGGNIAGTIEIAADATVRFAGGHFLLQDGAALTGEGTARVVGAEFEVVGNVSARRVELDYAPLYFPSRISGEGQLRISDAFWWVGGSMTGPGSIDIASGATFTVSGDTYKDFGTRILNNAGTTVWTGSGGLYSDTFGVFNNLAGATFLIENDAQFVPPSVLYPSQIWNNAGTIRKTGGTGVAWFRGFFHNSGTVDLQTGTLWLSGETTATGQFEVATGATLDFGEGAHALTAASSVAGSGKVAFTNGAGVQIDGAYHVATTEISGGAAHFNAAATTLDAVLAYDVTGNWGVLGGSGTLTVLTALEWRGGAMSGTGSTDLAAGATFTITGDAPKTFGDRTLNNAGTAVLTGSGGFYSDAYGVFNNLVGATFTWDTDAAIGLGSVLYPSLIWNNAGTIRKTGGTGVAFFLGFFHNSGTVDLQTGTLSLNGESTNSGSTVVATGAMLGFGQGTHTLAEGSSLTGSGTAHFWYESDVQVNGGYNVQVTRIEGGSANFNAEATTTIVALSAGALSGTGTLTVTGTLDWTGGWMEGTGATIIPSTGVLNLAGDGDRGLNGRRIFNSGQVTWNGLGAITRYTNGAWEVYDNTGVPHQPPAPGAFDPSAAADQLYRAMYGGLTGWGTTEEFVYQVLEGKTTAQIDAIKDSYSSHYSRSLLWDLQNELSGSEWTRAERLISGNRAAADAAALNYAMFGNISLGTDEETIFAILDGRTTTEVSAIAQAYEGLYGHTLESALRDELSGSQEQRALALLQGNQAQADAAALYYAMQGGLIGIGTDEEAIVKILGSRGLAQLDLIKQEYQQLYGQSLEDALREDLTAAEMDQATALLAGDPISAEAARLRQAMEGAGTDENAVWAVLDGKTSEKRAAIADAYRRMYSEELRDAIHDDFTDDPDIGNELSRTLALLDHGGLSPAERIWYAVKGWGTEEELLDPALRELSRMTPEQIAQVDAAYQALSGGESLRDGLDADLAGRAWFDAEQALQGQATTLEERLQRLSAKRASERDGVLNGISSFLLDGFSPHISWVFVGSSLRSGPTRGRG